MANERVSLLYDLIGRDNVSPAMRSASGSARDAGASFADLAKVAASTFVGTQIVQWARGAVMAASDVNEAVNLTGRLFGDNADRVVAWSEKSATAMGLSQSAALEAAGQMGGALKNMGYSLDDATTKTQELMTRASDMASAFNTDVQQALFAIQAGLRGETEPLRRFNVFLDEASIKAEAMSLGLYDGSGALDRFAKAQAIAGLVMKDTADVAGDFTMTADGLANGLRINAALLEDFKAQAGEAFRPLAETGLGAFNSLLGLVMRAPAPLRETATSMAVLTGAVMALGPALTMIKAHLTSGGAGGLAANLRNVAKSAGIAAAAFGAMKLFETAQAWDQLSGELDNFLNVMGRAGSVDEMNTAISAQQDRIDVLRRRMELLALANDDAAMEQASFGEQMNAVGVLISTWVTGADYATELAGAVEALGVAHKIQAAAAQESVDKAMALQEADGGTAESAAGVESAVSGAASALGVGADQAAAMTGAVTALTDAMDILNGTFVGQERARIAMNEAAKKFRQTLKEEKGFTDDAKSALLDYATAQVDNAIAMRENGKSRREVIGMLRDERERMLGAADAAGLDEAAKQKLTEKIQAYINKIKATPKDVTTRAYAHTEKATADMDALRDKLRALDGASATISVYGMGVDGVLNKLNAINAALQNADARAKGGPVKAGKKYTIGELGPEMYVWGGEAEGGVSDAELRRLLFGEMRGTNNDARIIGQNGQVDKWKPDKGSGQIVTYERMMRMLNRSFTDVERTTQSLRESLRGLADTMLRGKNIGEAYRNVQNALQEQQYGGVNARMGVQASADSIISFLQGGAFQARFPFSALAARIGVLGSVASAKEASKDYRNINLDPRTAEGRQYLSTVLSSVEAIRGYGTQMYEITGSRRKANAAMEAQYGSLAASLRAAGLTKTQVENLLGDFDTYKIGAPSLNIRTAEGRQFRSLVQDAAQSIREVGMWRVQAGGSITNANQAMLREYRSVRQMLRAAGMSNEQIDEALGTWDQYRISDPKRKPIAKLEVRLNLSGRDVHRALLELRQEMGGVGLGLG